MRGRGAAAQARRRVEIARSVQRWHRARSARPSHQAQSSGVAAGHWMAESAAMAWPLCATI